MSESTKEKMLEWIKGAIHEDWPDANECDMKDAIRRFIEKGPEVDEKKLFRLYNACWERDISMSFGVFLKSLELLGIRVKEAAEK